MFVQIIFKFKLKCNSGIARQQLNCPNKFDSNNKSHLPINKIIKYMKMFQQSRPILFFICFCLLVYLVADLQAPPQNKTHFLNFCKFCKKRELFGKSFKYPFTSVCVCVEFYHTPVTRSPPPPPHPPQQTKTHKNNNKKAFHTSIHARTAALLHPFFL